MNCILPTMVAEFKHARAKPNELINGLVYYMNQPSLKAQYGNTIFQDELCGNKVMNKLNRAEHSGSL